MPPRSRAGRLVFPALRWSEQSGFTHEEPAIRTALEIGAGGFVIFGGAAAAVRALTRDLRARAGRPLLIASDLERGAGQQFEGATALPPAAAFGWLDDLDATRHAGELTAREALALGVNWVYAPVADLDVEPRNPIVGTRAFGADAERVARHVAAFVRGCRSAGALSCAKHFPGHGRTTHDSHAELPVVDAPRDRLALDLRPFTAALSAGVETIMTAHVAYPALDARTVPATRSEPIIAGVLRRELGFAGLVVTDALIMEGVLQAGGESEAAISAVAAGCDALLYPQDPSVVATALAAAPESRLAASRLADAIERVEAFAARTPADGRGAWGQVRDREWAASVGARATFAARGEPVCPRSFELVTIDDDVGGPYPPPSRHVFPAQLRAAGFRVDEIDRPTGSRPVVMAVYADIRAWKGRPGLSAQARATCEEVAVVAEPALTVLFAHPRLADRVPGQALLVAWGGESAMQRAAALRLSGVVADR